MSYKIKTIDGELMFYKYVLLERSIQGNLIKDKMICQNQMRKLYYNFILNEHNMNESNFSNKMSVHNEYGIFEDPTQ